MATPLFHNLEAHGDQVAVIGNTNLSISYKSLVNQADVFAAAVKRRCLAVLICENSIACLVAYIGLHRAGCAVMLLHHSISPDQLTSILDSFRPAFLAKRKEELDTYDLEQTLYSQDYALHPDLCLLLTTSGTTGSRSFVRQSYKNVQSNAEAIIRFLSITQRERAITTMPMNYTYGLSIIHSHLLAGASLVVTEESLVSPTFWKLIKESAVTSFGGVPFIYEMLKKLRFEKMDIPSLRYITQAGGKLSVERVEEFAQICNQKRIRFMIMYGQTEATARMAYLPSEQLEKRPGSIGVPIPGGRFELYNDNNMLVDRPHIQGELYYYGDNVTMGYASGYADLAKGDENKGCLPTGDIAVRDEDGFYFIIGRKKRFLKIFGTRVSLDEVEEILKKAGCDCACGGSDDRLEVYIAGQFAPDKVAKILSEQTSLPVKGYSVIAVGSIPRNESGKVDYTCLKEMAAA